MIREIGIKRIYERITALSALLTSGGCQDFAEYKRAAGELKGLKDAVAIDREADQMAMESDPDGD